MINSEKVRFPFSKCLVDILPAGRIPGDKVTGRKHNGIRNKHKKSGTEGS